MTTIAIVLDFNLMFVRLYVVGSLNAKSRRVDLIITGFDMGRRLFDINKSIYFSFRYKLHGF